VPDAASLDALFLCASDADIGLEDWGSIRRLCASCSLDGPGPHEEHDPLVQRHSDGTIRLVAAAPDEPRLRALLDTWAVSDSAAAIVHVAIVPD
jgi:hypothetical protein